MHAQQRQRQGSDNATAKALGGRRRGTCVTALLIAAMIARLAAEALNIFLRCRVAQASVLTARCSSNQKALTPEHIVLYPNAKGCLVYERQKRSRLLLSVYARPLAQLAVAPSPLATCS